MLLSVDFAQVVNAPSALMLTLMIASMISGVTSVNVMSTAIGVKVESTAITSDVTCTSDCCRVIYIWQKMGQKTTVDPTNSTACCYYLGSTNQTSGIPGVNCTSKGTVTKIDWSNKGLTGPIPPEIGNLVNIEEL
jgi:hypothetical protein